MSVRDAIERKLRQELEPDHLEVIDESFMHAGGPDAQSHFRVFVVAEAFAGLSTLDRHRMVYRLLEPERAAGIHALGIQTLTPEEYAAAPRVHSPPCAGARG